VSVGVERNALPPPPETRTHIRLLGHQHAAWDGKKSKEKEKYENNNNSLCVWEGVGGVGGGSGADGEATDGEAGAVGSEWVMILGQTNLWTFV
jgi:hypothetical protein